ncbi:vegetative cell wall protein gp1-like [Morone saxatilis]|uniref:vegetative cell wall protein gp1-like n=1 Tax=Morone saxatilis TaxID=34816 RepID=UPI0015E21226|nr:vegetative cell wall protein gp1-like [Morone saxatilis]
MTIPLPAVPLLCGPAPRRGPVRLRGSSGVGSSCPGLLFPAGPPHRSLPSPLNSLPCAPRPPRPACVLLSLCRPRLFPPVPSCPPPLCRPSPRLPPHPSLPPAPARRPGPLTTSPPPLHSPPSPAASSCLPERAVPPSFPRPHLCPPAAPALSLPPPLPALCCPAVCLLRTLPPSLAPCHCPSRASPASPTPVPPPPGPGFPASPHRSPPPPLCSHMSFDAGLWAFATLPTPLWPAPAVRPPAPGLSAQLRPPGPTPLPYPAVLASPGTLCHTAPVCGLPALLSPPPSPPPLLLPGPASTRFTVPLPSPLRLTRVRCLHRHGRPLNRLGLSHVSPLRPAPPTAAFFLLVLSSSCPPPTLPSPFPGPSGPAVCGMPLSLVPLSWTHGPASRWELDRLLVSLVPPRPPWRPHLPLVVAFGTPPAPSAPLTTVCLPAVGLLAAVLPLPWFPSSFHPAPVDLPSPALSTAGHAPPSGCSSWRPLGHFPTCPPPAAGWPLPSLASSLTPFSLPPGTLLALPRPGFSLSHSAALVSGPPPPARPGSLRRPAWPPTAPFFIPLSPPGLRPPAGPLRPALPRPCCLAWRLPPLRTAGPLGRDSWFILGVLCLLSPIAT